MKTPKEDQTTKAGTTTASNQSKSNKSATSTSKRSNSAQNGDMLSGWGVTKNQLWGILGAVAGGALLYKGTRSGGKSKVNPKSIIEVKTNVLIKKPKEELYAYWRNLENLPDFMSHLKLVNEIDEKRSLWVAEGPGGLGRIEWEAEITWEQENRILAWRSLPDAEIENSGEVRFEPVGSKKTIVETTINYRPPAGKAGGVAAQLLNPAFKKVLENDLKEFKNIMEKGGKAKRKASKA
ncbi:cyclase [Antarcticibacterium flavum]|uniref:Cyclase n=1 Tax=Antarcticibacterium flavum TaxID=2058175 RepID=A0A5B7X2N8_9FLAO|nr:MULTISPECIES: SRPBCC family protein [Antarcticibacterium]MCM4159910.1 cyclase [Antarcticibacterium sp. W02-3]QCY68908.1 cyclase [Antarcticibacterium flavum]